MKLFSGKNRSIHLGPYRLEQLEQLDSLPLQEVPVFEQLSFNHGNRPTSIVNAMRDHQATLAVAAGGSVVQDDQLVAPYLGTRFGMAAVTATFEFAIDRPLDPAGITQRDKGTERYANWRFVDGAHPFEKLKRVDKPTTFIDELRVPRVPKRTDMFSRAQGHQLFSGCRRRRYFTLSRLDLVLARCSWQGYRPATRSSHFHDRGSGF